jgi:hypothetical protein
MAKAIGQAFQPIYSENDKLPQLPSTHNEVFNFALQSPNQGAAVIHRSQARRIPNQFPGLLATPPRIPVFVRQPNEIRQIDR